MFVDNPTPIDLHFRLFRFPCAIGGLFWVGAALMSGLPLNGPEAIKLMLIWIATVLVSILLHELGHAFAARYFGCRVLMVKLTMMGGYCQYDRQPPGYWPRIIIALGGITVQLILAGLLKLGDQLFQLPDKLAGVSLYLLLAYGFLLFINIYWAVFNLLPILPLDGGHVLETVLEMNRVPQAKVRARWFSVSVAVAIGVIAILSATENMPRGWYETTIMQWFRPTIFMGIFMFVLAMINYQQIQSMRASDGFSGSYRPSWRDEDDDGEAWKRR